MVATLETMACPTVQRPDHGQLGFPILKRDLVDPGVVAVLPRFRFGLDAERGGKLGQRLVYPARTAARLALQGRVGEQPLREPGVIAPRRRGWRSGRCRALASGSKVSSGAHAGMLLRRLRGKQDLGHPGGSVGEIADPIAARVRGRQPSRWGSSWPAGFSACRISRMRAGVPPPPESPTAAGTATAAMVSCRFGRENPPVCSVGTGEAEMEGGQALLSRAAAPESPRKVGGDAPHHPVLWRNRYFDGGGAD
jgi:hypothetical protein